jgi:hydrogenase expression/formation protein HypD
MKFMSEYRDPEIASRYVREIERLTTRTWTMMEICGGQTHAIIKNGIDQLLPDKIVLLHGPGCPVCVTPVEIIDRAIRLASQDNVIFCSFGDMLRVPGSREDLLSVRARGADVRVVYSPIDSLKIARRNPDCEVVFFAIGFETTAPANASAVYQAKQSGIDNFSILCAQVLVPPAIEAILRAEGNCVNGFLAAGHVCTVTGYVEYEKLAAEYGVPFVITGFEPLDILQGIHMLVARLEQGKAGVENQYSRVVRREGNVEARRLMRKVFHVIDRRWRGLGIIPDSGLGLKDNYAMYDAEKKFGLSGIGTEASSVCISGQILRGARKPPDCPAFGDGCTPEHPLGATMVSSEGACSAYYNYRRKRGKALTPSK